MSSPERKPKTHRPSAVVRKARKELVDEIKQLVKLSKAIECQENKELNCENGSKITEKDAKKLQKNVQNQLKKLVDMAVNDAGNRSEERETKRKSGKTSIRVVQAERELYDFMVAMAGELGISEDDVVYNTERREVLFQPTILSMVPALRYSAGQTAPYVSDGEGNKVKGGQNNLIILRHENGEETLVQRYLGNAISSAGVAFTARVSYLQDDNPVTENATVMNFYNVLKVASRLAVVQEHGTTTVKLDDSEKVTVAGMHDRVRERCQQLKAEAQA